jgi:hypothetical protein
MSARGSSGYERSACYFAALAVTILVLCAAPLSHAVPRHKKKKRGAVSPDDPTALLFSTLNASLGGKLSSLYLLADVYPNPANPEQQYQHVLEVTYDKSLFFGRLAIHVRSVVKMTPAQLAIYSPKQVFDFGGSDSEIFDRTNPGEFGGEQGDVYLRATGGGPLTTTPVTDDVAQEYTTLLTRYVLPAVRKRAGSS